MNFDLFQVNMTCCEQTKKKMDAFVGT